MRAIVCNAGVQVVSGAEATDDGVDMAFGVNHLAGYITAAPKRIHKAEWSKARPC